MIHPILVAGAAGRFGGVGGAVVDVLLRRGLPVRALVHRDDERADALRAAGAEVVVADLKRIGTLRIALFNGKAHLTYLTQMASWIKNMEHRQP